eukprot:scaffold401_cov399-Prasinococcus_capsulatus_cf.AAC.38
MYGDYEAQRHWMELTINLPAREWYAGGPHNDLQYWGLDYPPLTALQSMLCGYAIASLEPEAMELDTSHGMATTTNPPSGPSADLWRWPCQQAMRVIHRNCTCAGAC